jgi:hypothetical protein
MSHLRRKPTPSSGIEIVPGDPWAALDKLYNSNPEPTGPEWFTVQEYAERYGLSINGSASRLNNDKRLEKWIGMGGPNKRTLAKYRIRPT